MFSSIHEWYRKHFLTNVPAWIFFFLFVIAELGNYNHSKTITRLCELTGPHNVSVPHPRTAAQEIENICVGHQGSDE
jgi:hypothetical protein